MPKKLCTKCGNDGPFRKRKDSKDGLHGRCVSCMRERESKYRQKNKDRTSKYKTEWSKKNMTEDRKHRYRENWNKSYYEKYRAAHLATAKRNYQNMDDFIKRCRRAVSRHNFNAKQRKQKGKVGIKDIVKLFTNPQCAVLQCEQTENLEIDHVIPACFGGPNSPCNLQLLCPDHHRKKSSIEQAQLAEMQKSSKMKRAVNARVQMNLF